MMSRPGRRVVGVEKVDGDVADRGVSGTDRHQAEARRGHLVAR
jgi:hypothetical protein